MDKKTPFMKFDAPSNCLKCPRLVSFRKQASLDHPDWFNGAVPSFGDRNAQILIVGLAPGLQGANRTGRPFTGDYAGDLLYETLAHFGLSNDRYQKTADDGLELRHVMITNAVRCVPPQNKPISAEINQCRPYLQNTLTQLPNIKLLIALGRIAHDSVLSCFKLVKKDHPFGHNKLHRLTEQLQLIDSYHCSRYNTNTGRLTPEMFQDVFTQAKTICEF